MVNEVDWISFVTISAVSLLNEPSIYEEDDSDVEGIGSEWR